ncbi:Tyrosyl-tRNA synthetase [Solidesulfovibrio carbinoliphilus subsp. oakridgensis]|uniref:Tyrosine--tRNA ligase n=1 Tax=Solidesulfovibrio carbinoliphilus subsp. oakridgensis TaxID=694327 RepID=G7QAH9_9BACT|nr:tyrosine--tRNA ligase [Solidesulfovibrio carbinoliphilus]EHJ48732.1 Tyrosyl-tRNA synthetase [Solidesulfovibrio carbinoliphilus subsp. oakridgensis]
MNIFDELSWRGLLHQTSDDAGLRDHLETPGRVLYCGFDPTADSLHIGNLVPLLALARFAKAGHKPLFLLGGATGLIGDPSGKDKERQLKTEDLVGASAEKIKAQAMAFFERLGVADAVTPVNNLDWTRPISIIEFLRDTGKHFTINYMLAKDSVKSRIGREETGISYTEFSYMILQSLDFEHLCRTQGCTLQIGGGDQFGNITAGLELIRRKTGRQAYGLTFPLITTASGAKFGKSEKGAIFLNPELTSPYAFYQYWINADDRDVVNFLRYFTFLSQEDIEALAGQTEAEPHLRAAQKRLARETTAMIHGDAELAKVEAVTEALFGGGDLTTVDAATLKAALQAAPGRNYPTLGDVPPLPKLLADLALCPSNSQARKDIKAGGVSINNVRVTAEDRTLVPEDFLGGDLLILRKGKKNYGVVTLG